MKKLKVVTIGGGSSYTPELIEGFIKRYHEFPLSELWLVDIPEGKKKLEIVGNLAIRMFKKAELDVKVYMTLNRQEALKDADFVTTQIRVGLLDAREKDELIPIKYGVIGQETNGPGGMFNALRTIPVIFDILKDCEKLCPNAWVISFSNPSGIITEAVFRHTNFKRFIGLCNGPVNMVKDIEKFLHISNDDDLLVKIGGINHMIYALDINLNGKNVNNTLIENIVNSANDESLKNITNISWSKEFIKGLGYYGIGYNRYYMQKHDMLEACISDAKKHQCRAQVVKELEKELFIKYSDETLDIKPKELENRGGAYYSDAACSLISSIYNNKKDIQVVDTLNNGAISNLSNDVAVEVSCIITKNGPIPLTVGKLPPEICGLIQQLKQFEILTTDVALSGDYNKALLALTINPLVQSEKVAKKILDEMLEAHKEFLPQFKNYFDNKNIGETNE